MPWQRSGVVLLVVIQAHDADRRTHPFLVLYELLNQTRSIFGERIIIRMVVRHVRTRSAVLAKHLPPFPLECRPRIDISRKTCKPSNALAVDSPDTLHFVACNLQLRHDNDTTVEPQIPTRPRLPISIIAPGTPAQKVEGLHKKSPFWRLRGDFICKAGGGVTDALRLVLSG
jgi:hypothetical protein